MRVTREFILKHRTVRGSWTRPQIEALGLEWPPREGWMDRVVGRELTEAQVAQFRDNTIPRKALGRQYNPDQSSLF